MLDHDHRVSAARQADDGSAELLDIVWMQSHRRFIEHVQHIDQAGPQRGRQRRALTLASA